MCLKRVYFLFINSTQLQREDTQEFRDREQHAARIANEIERGDKYRENVDMENGDGEDEEMRFSAVNRSDGASGHRSEDGASAHRQDGASAGSEGGEGGKYVPPHLRSAPGGNLGVARGGSPGVVKPQQSIAPTQQQWQHQQPPSMSVSASQQQQVTI